MKEENSSANPTYHTVFIAKSIAKSKANCDVKTNRGLLYTKEKQETMKA